ncbi:MFS transporter [Rugosimonospora africana]|uniref:MFS transporter n=1 Tax=Rugosimonospora africana TaxID=556532 RepID=A0A8J3VRP8_9ACTN|nr:MFS transporter [Rugosimonospora africana]GIH15613.1 MFS transporter [Rugosimonospora africana]
MSRQNRNIRTKPRPILPVLILAAFSFSVIQSLVAPVLPEIQRELHTTQSTVTWIITAYLLSASIFTPILGRLGDRVGKDKVLFVALIALAVGLAISAIAPNIGIMLVGRVVQGFGGGIFPLAFGIVRDEVPRERVAGTVGILASLLAVGLGLGAVLAGPIVDVLDSRALFWLPMILVVTAAVASYFVIPPSPTRSPGQFSWAASVLLGAWLILLLVPLSEASAWGWGSARVLGMFIAAGVLAVAWIVVEAKATSPLIDMRMMRIPAVWTTNLVSLLFGVAMYGMIGFLPAFLQTPPAAGYGFGASITEAGLLMLPMSVTMFGSGVVTPPLSHRVGAKKVLVVGTVITLASFVILVLAHTREWEILLAMAILGVGFGAAFATMSNVIVAAVPPHQTGVANGMNTNIRSIGGAIGAAVMASVVSAHALPSGLPAEKGYTYGFTALGIATAGAALAAFLVPRNHQHADEHEAQPTILEEEAYAEAAVIGVPGLGDE